MLDMIFSQLETFEDSEIYDNMFAANDINIKERVKDNANAFAIISEMMNEAYALYKAKYEEVYGIPLVFEREEKGAETEEL